MNDQEYYKAVGTNIKKIRLAKGIKQIELAANCDFDRQNMFKIENSGMNLTLKTLRIIAQALDVSVIDLLYFKPKK
ncbi:MAG: helix-turn-helix transcriptional regulator [Bacteroidota bacterium]